MSKFNRKKNLVFVRVRAVRKFPIIFFFFFYEWQIATAGNFEVNLDW